MALRHPKLKISIPPGVINSGTIFDLIRVRYNISYCGIFSCGDSIHVYVYNKERMSAKIIREILQGTTRILSIQKYSKLSGELCDETGEFPQHGGHNKPDRLKDLPPPPVKRQKHGISHERQPPLLAPKPDGKRSFVLDQVQNSPSNPDNFHPIWSSKDGRWAPYFWVGPSRSIRHGKRVQPHPRVVESLYTLQDDKCRLCNTPVVHGTYSNSDVDHIVPIHLGGQTTESNLQILCVCCHRRKTSLESRKLSTRMTEPEIKLEDGVVYSVSSHVFFEPDSRGPLDAKGSLGAEPGGIYRLFH
jgi:5-methylcytosine-specific restriction endonuclease McrA